MVYFKDEIRYETALEISNELIELFEKEEFDICDTIYSHFKSAIAQDVIKKQLIPIDIKDQDGTEKLVTSPINYEESQEKLLA